jgi:hypothetical protein
MVKQYKIQRSKRGNLIRMPAKVSEYYERHEEKNGVIWFRPSSKPKVKLPAEAMVAPAPVPTPVSAPAPTQPVVIISRKPVAAPRPTAPPTPVRRVAAPAAPPVPKLPRSPKDLSPVEQRKLLVVTNRMFGRDGVIRANALPEGMG